MNKIILTLAGLFFLVLTVNLISASDILVWQGQYYTGTTFNTGTYNFNFTVYDALTGGNICYSNLTTLTTGSFGEWKTEQAGISSACNNVSKDYYLNININGVNQTPRKRLVVWTFLRKDVNETTAGELQTNSQIIAPIINATIVRVSNLTTTDYGFFSYIGSVVNRITKLWVIDINATGNIETSQNVSSMYFKGNGSLLTNLPAGSGLTPVYLGDNLNSSTSTAYTTIFNITLTPSKVNIIHAFLTQSSSTLNVAIQNRAIINESGPTGYCTFVTQTDGAQAIDNIAVDTTSADTGESTMGFGTNVPFINIISCSVLADSSLKDLIIQFSSETTANVTTYAGSYYTNAVN